MTHEDQAKFPGVSVALKDGRVVVIRPLKLSDDPALGTFYESVPREDFRFYCPHLLTRDNAMKVAAAAMDPREVVLVIDANDRISGYAWFRWSSSTWQMQKIESPQDSEPTSTFGICIARSHQNSGAGRLIMSRLLEIARHVGPPRMSLTVQLANPRAVKLYQSMGFEVVREQMRPANDAFDLRAEPEYVMQRRVH